MASQGGKGRCGHDGSMVARWLLRLPSRYRVAIAVWLAPAVATAIARWALGDDPTAAQVARLGYGIPALADGRLWTLVTGALVAQSLTIPLVPSFSFVAVALLEHKAGHWRSAVAFVAGQLLGVLLAALVTWPLRGSDGAFAREMTDTVDFGFSVGGFAAIGLWTCYLRAPLRRPLRVGIGLYLLGQLLLSGLVYDVSHPIGFLLGITAGARWLLPPRRLDRSPVRVPADVLWIVAGAAIGIAAGVLAGWNARGVGGLFGWGPD
jgi:hypothetical protein